MPGDPGLPRSSSAKFGFRGGRIFITPIKNLPSRWEVVAECLKEGAMGPGRGTGSRREGEKQITDNIPKRTHKNL